jgi:dihydroneopterin aldolase
MTGFLASVASVEEAKIALTGGADIIDLKNPHAGALGALPLTTIADTVKLINNNAQTSATIGDLTADSGSIPDAVRAMQTTKVDFIKIGLFSEGGDLSELISSLCNEASNYKLIAVLFADQPLDLTLLPQLAEANFHGVMLDTATKQGSGLRANLPDRDLASFVQTAKQLGLISGLAGQLSTSDIPSLLPLDPDYLGFRSALCTQHKRTQPIDSKAIATVRNLLNSLKGSVPF